MKISYFKYQERVWMKRIVLDNGKIIISKATEAEILKFENKITGNKNDNKI